MNKKYNNFLKELSENENIISNYLFEEAKLIQKIKPSIIEECTMSYLRRGGKKLRPAVLMLSCMALGGKKEAAIPAAAAVELFHTWTLVHDDIIDNDHLRRGLETVHITAKNYAKEKLSFDDIASDKYGKDVAILTGDIQHGWAISILTRNLSKKGIKPEIVLHLVSVMQVEMLRTLVEGELLDVDYGLFYDINDLSEDQILDMLWKKTGAFYEFCGLAGGLIGQNNLDFTPQVNNLKEFCSLCGTAFQVRDDILGLIGNEKELGKPIGSDIREGKKTLLIKEAISNGNDEEIQIIRNTLGNPNASRNDIETTTKLVIKLGGVERAHSVAKFYVEKAIPYLDVLPDSKSKNLLYDWANYMIDRTY